MEFFGLIAFILVLSFYLKLNKLEKKIKLLKKNHKGIDNMTRIISQLKGQKCIIKYELNPITWKKDTIECDIIDVDDEWIKVFFTDKKGIQRTKIIRIENIEDVELI